MHIYMHTICMLAQDRCVCRCSPTALLNVLRLLEIDLTVNIYIELFYSHFNSLFFY